METTTACLELADLIIAMTDSSITKQQKEQLEVLARVKAKSYKEKR